MLDRKVPLLLVSKNMRLAEVFTFVTEALRKSAVLATASDYVSSGYRLLYAAR